LDGFGRVWNTEKQAPENMETEHKLVYHWTGLIAEDDLPWFKSATAAVNVKSIYFVVNPKTIVYDSLQRVLSVKEPDGNVTKYAYDGLKTTITDPNNNVTRQFQDAYGRLVRTEQDNDDGTYVTINEYDALGRLIRVLDANYNAGVSSKPIGYKYDSLGRMIYSSDPYSGETVYHYDLIGNSISKTDAKGNKLIYEYDPLNRLTKKSVLTPDGTVPTVLSRNVYDEPTSTNGVGRLTSTFIGNATLDGKYNYEYDTDVLSRVTGFVKYSDWRSMGIPETITCENGVTVYYLHHPGTLRLVRLNTRAPDYEYIQSFDYEYDNAGNITAISDNASITSMHTVATTQNFEYDKINRLKKSGFGTYSYDRVGNITAKEGITFGYNDSNHPYCLTTGNNGYKAVYDLNGNLLEKTDQNGVYWRYQYNAENMLIAVYQGPEKGKEYLVEEYFYDAAGMRSQKKTYNGATATNTHYIYLGNNVLYETGPEKTRYILGNGREIAKVVNGKTYYTHRDHLGSSSVVTDSAGAVVNWNANHPYGENWQVSPAGTADLDKHRFTGKETDSATGLIYFGARFYDPEVGRFITVDPGKDGMNWYAYCNDNPINNFDPDGRETVGLGGSASAAFLARLGVSGTIVIDDKGNIGFALGGDVGGGFPNASAGGAAQITTANTIFDLNGPSTNVGFVFGPGVEIIITDKYVGANIAIKPFTTPTPDAHAVYSGTKVFSLNWLGEKMKNEAKKVVESGVKEIWNKLSDEAQDKIKETLGLPDDFMEDDTDDTDDDNW
jgi:RHS repeat-associated protein